MFVKTIKYEDFNGVEKIKDCYFNLNESEIIELEIRGEGGYHEMLDRAIKAKDGKVLMETFNELIHKAYGVKSADGERFEKSEEIYNAFYHSNAYNALFMELVFDAKKAGEFVNNLFPAKMMERLLAKVEASSNKQ